MFKTLVLVCSLIDPSNCIEMENTRHPILTEKACVARAMEMARDLNRYMPNFKAMSYKCIPLKKGTLT